MMPLPGSDPAAAVAQAVDLLHSAGIRDGRILLVTDGIGDRTAPLSSRPWPTAVRAWRCWAWAPPPVRRYRCPAAASSGRRRHHRDARAGRGAAARAGRRHRRPLHGHANRHSDLDTLLAESPLAGREQTVTLDRTADTWEDQGYLLVLLLLPLALALFRRGWVLCLLPLLLMAQPQPVRAAGWDDLWLTPDQQGQRALQQGDSEQAVNLFERPDWAGTAAYQGEDFATAANKFAEGDDADSWYNRGNAWPGR